MALASDKTLKQFADKLEKWAEDLSYGTSPAKNLWMELNLSLYPRDIQDTIYWLAVIPGIEKKITRHLEELSKLVQEVDAWRNHGIYPEDIEEFRARIDRLKQVTKNIIDILRKTLAASEIQPPAPEAIAVEKSDPPRTQVTGPAGIKKDVAASRMPQKEALTAYKLYFDEGLTLPQIARRITAELQLDKPLRQRQVARWIKQVVQWHIRTRIPIQSIPGKAAGTTKPSIKIDAAVQIEHKK